MNYIEELLHGPVGAGLVVLVVILIGVLADAPGHRSKYSDDDDSGPEPTSRD